MKLFMPLIVTLVLAGTSAPADAQSILCAKQNIKTPRSGKSIKLSTSFGATTGECPPGYSEIFAERSSADALSSLKDIDGAGSGLDADLLDGKTSAEFATAADLSTLSSSVSSVQSSLATVESSVSTAQSLISSLQSSVATTQSSLTSTQSSLTSAQTSITTLQTTVASLASETRLPRIVRVASSGGDYTSLATAVASLASPSSNNPYLIQLAPGTFTLAAALVIPSGVLLQGSGVGITTITGAVGGASPTDGALLKFSEGAKLKDVTVINTYDGAANFNAGLAFTDLTSAPSSNPGEYSTEIDGVRIVMPSPNGIAAYGIYIRGSDVRIRRTSISGTDAAGFYVGVYLDGFGSTCSAYIEDSSIFVSGSIAYGIMVNGSAGMIHLLGSEVRSNDRAIDLASSGDIRIFRSSVIATNTAVAASGAFGVAVINSSEISGSPRTSTSGGATLTCTNVASPAGGVATCP